MILKIHSQFKDAQLIISNVQQDYNTYEENEIIIFVYGYPINFKTKEWLTAKTIYSYYVQNDLGFIHDIDGIYSIIICDKPKKYLKIITDRIGIYTMFYYKNQESLLISDQVKELKSHIPTVRINKESMIEMLNLGFKIGNKTLYQEITEFEPAQVYSVNPDLTFTEERYWDAFDKKPSEIITKEEFRLMFNSNLNIVAGLEDKIVCPLSGGKDTRMLLSSVLDHKSKLHCYTYGSSFHTDLKASRQICKHFQISHDFIPLDDDFAKQLDFDKYLGEMNYNGIGPYFHNFHVREFALSQQINAPLTFRGDLGNQLWRHHPFGSNVPESMDYQINALWILKNLPKVLFFKGDLTNAYSKLYKNHSIQDIVSLIQSTIAEDLQKIKDPKKPSDFSEFFLLRGIGYNFYNIMKYIGRHFKLYLPILQKDVLQQLHLLSIEERVKGTYNDYIISNNDEFLANMPYYNSGRILKYIKLISNSISQKAINTNFFNHPELHNYPQWIRNYHKEVFLHTLDYDRMVLADLFNREELQSIIDKFISNKFSVSSKKSILYKYSNQWFVYNLFSLEHWLQNQ